MIITLIVAFSTSIQALVSSICRVILTPLLRWTPLYHWSIGLDERNAQLTVNAVARTCELKEEIRTRRLREQARRKREKESEARNNAKSAEDVKDRGNSNDRNRVSFSQDLEQGQNGDV
jgi:hypothetical protein